MTLWHLIRREIAHRKVNFLLSVFSIAAAAACLVGAEAILKSDQIATDALLAARQTEAEEAIRQKEEQVAKTGAALEDAIRRQMLGLGFNVLILPEEQDLSELHLNGSLSATMPASHVDKLAQSSIVTVNHLLPAVTRRVQWPEQDMEVVLYGTRGEVPIMHRSEKKPLLDAVAPGQMVVGADIHRKVGLKVGQSLEFMGRTFTVSKLHPERGSVDDVTVWIDLGQAQEMLGMQNLVHAILALECECAGDRISQIRQEIGALLPGTKVIERYSQALARAEARAKAKETAEASLAQERAAGTAMLEREAKARADFESQRRTLAATLVPIVLAAAAALVAALAYSNARQRREEVGILRSIGLRTRQIMAVFLGRAALTGCIGGLAGVALGLACGFTFGGLASPQAAEQALASGRLLFTLASAPLMMIALAMIASWMAALFAARQDAALVLQGE